MRPLRFNTYIGVYCEREVVVVATPPLPPLPSPARAAGVAAFDESVRAGEIEARQLKLGVYLLINKYFL